MTAMSSKFTPDICLLGPIRQLRRLEGCSALHAGYLQTAETLHVLGKGAELCCTGTHFVHARLVSFRGTSWSRQKCPFVYDAELLRGQR